MPRASSSKQSSQRHDPLATQMQRADLEASGSFSQPGRRAKKEKRLQPEEEAELDSKTSRKILKMARDQRDDVDAEDLGLERIALPRTESTSKRLRMNENGTFEDEYASDIADDDDDEDEEEYEELELDEDELDGYVPGGELEPGQTLADLIMAKIEEQEGAAAAAAAKKDGSSTKRPAAAGPELNPKVVEVYTKIGDLLSRYKSGPLPKAFKIMPSLKTWPHLIMLTNPEKWTANALYAATKLFASNLDPRQAQRFYRDILLEKIREEMDETGKLSVHSYAALKKALYKPAAFFKGILFPLCESQTCTLREAAILGSVLSKVSVPVLHSGAALLKLAEMDYSGPNSVFIRVLLDKKYALPYKVVDALVFHFIRFKRDPRALPVLWHQSFLIFAQRYKADLTPEQKEALLDVLKAKAHPLIGPEIRRELTADTEPRGPGEMYEPLAMEVEIA